MLATLLLRPNLDPQRFGLLETERSDRIRCIRGEPHDVTMTAEMLPAMCTGCKILQPATFDHMPARRAFSTTRDLYPRLIHKGSVLFGVKHTGVEMVRRCAQATETPTSDRLRLGVPRRFGPSRK